MLRTETKWWRLFLSETSCAVPAQTDACDELYLIAEEVMSTNAGIEERKQWPDYWIQISSHCEYHPVRLARISLAMTRITILTNRSHNIYRDTTKSSWRTTDQIMSFSRAETRWPLSSRLSLRSDEASVHWIWSDTEDKYVMGSDPGDNFRRVHHTLFTPYADMILIGRSQYVVWIYCGCSVTSYKGRISTFSLMPLPLVLVFGVVVKARKIGSQRYCHKSVFLCYAIPLRLTEPMICRLFHTSSRTNWEGRRYYLL
jgi:hypothetical protein